MYSLSSQSLVDKLLRGSPESQLEVFHILVMGDSFLDRLEEVLLDRYALWQNGRVNLICKSKVFVLV